MKLAEINITKDQLINASILDGINILIWQNSKDGAKGRNRPKSVVDRLIGKEEKKMEKLDTYVFDSIDDFESFVKGKEKREDDVDE